MLDSFTANPLPFAIAAVIAVFLLIVSWKVLKGVAKGFVMLILFAAIVGVIAWMALGGPRPS